MNSTITLPRSVVEQALDALQDANTMMEHRQDVKLRHSAMADLRAALEQEPEAWDNCRGERQCRIWCGNKHCVSHPAPQPPVVEQPQGEQEPVAWIEHEWSGSGLRHLHFERPAPTVRDEVVRPVWTPLYPRPQPRQPLTDTQINDHRIALAYDSEDLPDPWDFKQGVRAAERAHRIGGEA